MRLNSQKNKIPTYNTADKTNLMITCYSYFNCLAYLCLTHIKLIKNTYDHCYSWHRIEEWRIQKPFQPIVNYLLCYTTQYIPTISLLYFFNLFKLLFIIFMVGVVDRISKMQLKQATYWTWRSYVIIKDSIVTFTFLHREC